MALLGDEERAELLVDETLGVLHQFEGHSEVAVAFNEAADHGDALFEYFQVG